MERAGQARRHVSGEEETCLCAQGHSCTCVSVLAHVLASLGDPSMCVHVPNAKGGLGDLPFFVLCILRCLLLGWELAYFSNMGLGKKRLGTKWHEILCMQRIFYFLTGDVLANREAGAKVFL